MPEHHKGRGAAMNTPNRFAQLSYEPIVVDRIDEEETEIRTQFLNDTSRTILAKNDSPDIPFTYSLNPYRGCEHGCIYCYARPSHEYLGFSAGIDFESKILVKRNAPELLREEFTSKHWEPQMVTLSGNTDCYQPIERKLEITRRCLEVFLKYRNPVGIITKNFLVTRDIDILAELASLDLVMVTITITTLNADLVRRMEPRTSTPEKRLEAIRLLTRNGIPTTVFVAPVIPGLTGEEIPALLRAASNAGARFAGYTMLRLPGPVEPLFLEWSARELPDRASKIIHQVQEMRGGKLNSVEFGKRMRGEGIAARAIDRLFKLNCKRYGMNENNFKFATKHFRRDTQGQLEMFG